VDRSRAGVVSIPVFENVEEEVRNKENEDGIDNVIRPFHLVVLGNFNNNKIIKFLVMLGF